MLVRVVVSLLILVFVSGCKIADLSQPQKSSAVESKNIATEKINEVIEAQGFEIMKSNNLYSVEVTDDWKGFFGKMAKLWEEPTTTFSFKFNFNTFDGNAVFLSGKKKGDLIGLQSWTFYHKTKGSDTYENRDTGEKHNPMEFGLATLHYFIELPYRLRQAPIKKYYGQKRYKGTTYDLVFVSWGSEAPNKEYDQYILWINTNSKLVEYCEYTLRENNNPFTRQKYGSIAYLDYEDKDGFLYPTKLPVFLDSNVFKKPLEAYFHQFTIHSFSFGNFDETALYPLEGLEKVIDSKF